MAAKPEEMGTGEEGPTPIAIIRVKLDHISTTLGSSLPPL